jgi:hypothetical protein
MDEDMGDLLAARSFEDSNRGDASDDAADCCLTATPFPTVLGTDMALATPGFALTGRATIGTGTGKGVAAQATAVSLADAKAGVGAEASASAEVRSHKLTLRCGTAADDPSTSVFSVDVCSKDNQCSTSLSEIFLGSFASPYI